jgi:hypothetical protein
MARGTWGGTTDPNIFSVRMLFLLGTSHCQIGFKLRDVGVQDNSAQDVADEVATQLQEPLRAILAQTDSVVGVDVLKMGTDEGGWNPAETTTGANLTDTPNELPNFIAANVTLKSEIRKRYGQGRFFLPLVNDNQVNGNVITSTGLANIASFTDQLASHFMGDPLTHDLLLVNAHPLLPARGAPGSPGARPEIPASWYDVVSIRVNTIVTGLRSRKAGVGG